MKEVNTWCIHKLRLSVVELCGSLSCFLLNGTKRVVFPRRKRNGGEHTSEHETLCQWWTLMAIIIIIVQEYGKAEQENNRASFSAYNI